MDKKKKVFIVNSHWNNRGDEAALRSLIDSLLERDCEVSIQLCTPVVKQFPYDNVQCMPEYPRLRHAPEFILCVLSNQKFMPKRGKAFFKELLEADLILHGPGGPSIGDIYGAKEINYLLRLWAAFRAHKPYIVCAPSAGPFTKKIRNVFRRFIYQNAEKIILREEISKKYLDMLIPENQAIVACDLAIQNDIDLTNNHNKLIKDESLVDFLGNGENVIGITITDLQWHPKYSGNMEMKRRIEDAFRGTIQWLKDNGYKIIFIPQQFGLGNDYTYMEKFCGEQCYMLSDKYDCYFQQYIISKLHCVIGMRYHSNIFSAKMKIPFVSISYEQKMQGFVEKIDYRDYCIDIVNLSKKEIVDRFISLENNYQKIKNHLERVNKKLKMDSKKTINEVFYCLDSLEE